MVSEVRSGVRTEAYAGTVHFRDFTGNDREMGLLFEDFGSSFLRIECPVLEVYEGHKQIEWNDIPEGDAKRFPVMATDIYVSGAGGLSTIIETKCVTEPFGGVGGTHVDSLCSEHLYQLFAYLTNHARSCPAEPPPLDGEDASSAA